MVLFASCDEASLVRGTLLRYLQKAKLLGHAGVLEHPLRPGLKIAVFYNSFGVQGLKIYAFYNVFGAKGFPRNTKQHGTATKCPTPLSPKNP